MSATRAGYKQTEVGVIPEDWEVKSLGQISDTVRGGSPRPAGDPKFFNGTFIPWLTVAALTNIPESRLVVTETATCLTEEGSLRSRTLLPGTLIIANSGATLGVAKILGIRCCANDGIAALLNIDKDVSAKYLAHFINTRTDYLRDVVATGNGQPNLNTGLIGDFTVPLPATKEEQEAIAEALSDTDALIESLEQLLAKKRHLKQGTMQELLTGKKRLPGFSGEWEVMRLEDVADCLDNLRIPLNEFQRQKMQGEIPYCGANGVLDFVDDYVIDDDIILIAEDGGYFGEYAYRPIAYRMIGKCWVNNHAHILKAKEGHNQGFIFYSLVHKNILNFLASGTRAKLNKSEMWKIEVKIPLDEDEQSAIATVLSDIDTEIAALESQLTKTRALKQGMMQKLLTGEIRLI